jgi:hypothetical protein
MTKQELLEKLNSSDELVRMAFVPVSEVINWVNELEEETTTLGDDLVDQIAEEIMDLGLDLISDYDLSMSYREVELDSIDFNEDAIKESIKRAIRNN